MVEILVGIAVAAAMVAFNRWMDFESWGYTLGLASLPLFYMTFGLFATGEHVVRSEFLYGIPFLAASAATLFWNFRLSAYVIGLGWAAHGAYDLWKDLLFMNDGVWSWYPLFCAGVDFALGGYLLLLAAKLPNASFRSALHTASGRT